MIEYLKLDELIENTTSVRQNRIFTSQVQKFMDEVRSNIDPFSEEICRSKLFNLTTGKAASDDTVDFLLKSKSIDFYYIIMESNRCKNSSKNVGMISVDSKDQ